VLAFERRPGVFDVVDVVDGVAVVADLPEGEGLGFLCGGEGVVSLSFRSFVWAFSEVEQDWVESAWIDRSETSCTYVVAVAGPAEDYLLSDFEAGGDVGDVDCCVGEGAEEGEQGGGNGELHCDEMVVCWSCSWFKGDCVDCFSD
jgi:hypothetical protein